MTTMRDADMPLLDRIEAAIRRVTSGSAQMRVPVEATDSDIVLADCRKEIERLTRCLHQANAGFEHFEREWYLRGDRIADLERQLAEEHAEHHNHVYRLREQIGRDTETILTLRGLLSLAREALADCLDEARAEMEQLERENTTLRNQRDELRLLLDRRPAMNAGLREAYAEWSASVATLDWLDAIDGGEKE